MSKRFRLSTALDVDDLLLECIPYAIKLANEKYKFDPPLTIHEVDHWGALGTRADVIFEYFDDPHFFETQPVIQGAKEFVRKLSKMTEIFISTSVPSKFAGIRAERLIKEFPEIPEANIYIGTRKDRINVDILFDDGMHNVFKSNAAYPILMRRPWNQNATGMLAVNTYDEFLKLVEVISKSYTINPAQMENPKIVCLVGPSGSGKSKIAKQIIDRNTDFIKLKSYTTVDPTAVRQNDWYNYVSKAEFIKLVDSGELFESTMYAGHGYGSRKKDVDEIIASGKTVLASVDICGAMSLKANYEDVVLVYIKKDRKELLTNILQKKCSDEDKVNRIISIEDEKRNEEICDYVVNVTNKDYSIAVDEILGLLKK